MARRCDLSGKKALKGNNVSHANNKTKRLQNANLQSKSLFVPERGRAVKLKLSTRALRTVDKIGLLAYMRQEGLDIRQL